MIQMRRPYAHRQRVPPPRYFRATAVTCRCHQPGRSHIHERASAPWIRGSLASQTTQILLLEDLEDDETTGHLLERTGRRSSPFRGG
jgi:hypothetical protein